MDDVRHPIPEPGLPAAAGSASMQETALSAFLRWQAENPPLEDYYRVFMANDPPDHIVAPPAQLPGVAGNPGADNAAALGAWERLIETTGMPDDDLR